MLSALGEVIIIKYALSSFRTVIWQASLIMVLLRVAIYETASFMRKYLEEKIIVLSRQDITELSAAASDAIFHKTQWEETHIYNDFIGLPWNIASAGRMAIRLEGGHTESVLSSDCARDGAGHIVTGAENGQVCLWSHNGSLIGKVDLGEDTDVASVCFLQNKTDLLYCSASENVHLLDRRQFSGPIESHSFNEDDINQIAVNEKEEYLASCDDSGEIKLFNINTKKVFKTLRKHTNICASVTFRPKRPWDLLSGSYDQRLIQWDFSRAKAVCDINISEVGVTPDQFDCYLVNPPFIHSISLSAGGCLLACGTENALVQIFDASNKTLSYMTALKGHTQGVSQVHFPKFDDCTLLSGGNDGICNLWKLNTVAATYHCNGFSAHTGGAAAHAHDHVQASSSAPTAAPHAVSDGHANDITSEEESGSEDDPATLSPRPCYGIQHDDKINWITTGATSSRKFIVIADSTNEATVYTYPDQ